MGRAPVVLTSVTSEPVTHTVAAWTRKRVWDAGRPPASSPRSLKQLLANVTPQQAFSNNAAVCVCVGGGGLLSQASHYVGCNLSFSRPGRSSGPTEWGPSAGPRCPSCAFTLLSSATLIRNREGGVGLWGRGVAELGGGVGCSGSVAGPTETGGTG